MMENREVLIKESVLEDIGDAIQEKLKTKKKFLPEDLGDEIRGIEVSDLSFSYKCTLKNLITPFNITISEVN